MAEEWDNVVYIVTVIVSAQHALRLSAFGHLYKILGIPPLENIAAEENSA